MNRKSLCPLLMVVLWGAVALSARPALAQDSADPSADAEATSDHDKVIREQSIYIPYEKLRRVFETEGRGVFLPYERFRELWEAAREKTKPPADEEPPVGALITEVENEAVAEEGVVRVKAVVKIEIIAEGWSEIPLRLADAAITKATLGEGDEPARIVAHGDAGYKLLVKREGDGPQQIELALEYAKAITRTPGRNSVSFQAPQAPVSRWRVRIPEPGVKVDLHPLIAATDVPAGQEEGAEAPDDAPGAGETVVLAFVGAAPTVRIEWTPKAEGAAGMEALASVQVEEQVSISEGARRTRSQLAYTISRAELGSLSIEVPSNQKVVNVFDANVRRWSVDQTDGKQQINVQLFEPAKGAQNVVVELEQFAADEGEALDRAEILVPVVKALGVGRQQGVVVVQVAEGLRAETTKVSGLLQVDAAELPQALARGNWTFSYRYAAVPFELALSLEKIQPRIVVDSLVEAQLEPKRLALDMLAVYTVERAGVFRLELDIPAGYEVREVRGVAADGIEAVEVDSRHLEGDDQTRLVVNLARKALGRVGLLVQLERKLDEPNLLKPSGKAEIQLPVPQVAPHSVERASGRLVIYAAENLLVNPVDEEPEGFRSITTKAALEGMVPAPGRDLGKVRPVKAYAYTQERALLVLRAERRKPQVRVRQLLIARIEDGAVNYQATFFYDVLYSSVNSLRIDVPRDVAAELRNDTPTMQEKQIVPAPEDLPEGYVAWGFTGEAELIGEQKIELSWKEQLDQQVGSGNPVEVTIPQLRPAGADLPWGQIVLSKAETIDLRESGETVALRPIDPQHDLMPGAQVAGAAAAYEFHDDWSLTIAATRYELEEVQQTSIERAVLRMVVIRAGQIKVQALYRMRSARQRLAVRLPQDGEFDTEPRINGRPVPLEIEQGRKGEYLVPLLGQDADESFLLELRYTVPCEGNRFRLDRPAFPLDPVAGGESAVGEPSEEEPGAGGTVEPAMQQMYLCVYLPHELDLVDKDGPWTEEFSWGLSETLDFRPIARPREVSLLRWVAPNQDPNESFPTDGRLYLFSALRPAPPPDGSLQLVTVDRDWLNACVIGAVVLVGLLLVPFGAGKRVFVIGVCAIALVICAVFYPILLWQMCDGVLASACAIVLVVWTVRYFVWTYPRALAKRRAVKPQQPPPGPPAGTGGSSSPFAGPTGSQGPKPPPEPAPKPGASPPGESAIEVDPSKVEQSPEVVVVEEPPKEEGPRADRDEGGQTDA